MRFVYYYDKNLPINVERVEKDLRDRRWLEDIDSIAFLPTDGKVELTVIPECK